MTQKLENIFNECVERVLQGESIEDCLKSYPEEATKLEPLLKLAISVHKNAISIQPRPAFKEQTCLNLRRAFLYARCQKQPRVEVGFRGWQQRWAFAVATILVVFLIGAGTTLAATQALPDEPLYPVKLATEQVEMILAFSNIQKVKLQAKFAERRALEIAEMARRGKIIYITRATERLLNHLDKTSYYTTVVIPARPEVKIAPPIPKEPLTPPGPPLPPEQAIELKKLLEERASRSLAALELALKQAPEEAKPALRYAIEMQKKKYQKILEGLTEETPPKPPYKPRK